MIQSHTLPMSCVSGLGLSLLLGGHCSCQSLLLAGEGVTDMPPSNWNKPAQVSLVLSASSHLYMVSGSGSVVLC